MKRILLMAMCLIAAFSAIWAADEVTISDFKIVPGETKEVRILLNNDAAYVAFQFDLYLPKGLSVVSFSADRNRVPSNTTLSMSQQSDGSYRFIAAAMKAEALVGNSGAIATLTVKAESAVETGNMTGYFREVKLAMADATGQTYSEMSFPIIIMGSSLTLGDANGDSKVDAIDIVDIVNYMMGNSTSTGKFNKGAVDMNNDGTINAADIVKIVNIIMGN